MNCSKYYLTGRSLKNEGDYKNAKQMYRKAIEDGDPKGYYGLAVLLESEETDQEILKRAYKEPLTRILQNANNGDHIAASIVGVYYAFGLGDVQQDQTRAHLFFLIGALGGDEVAQYNLAIHFMLGLVAEKNLEQAHFWLKKAVDKKYKPAMELVESIGREGDNNDI